MKDTPRLIEHAFPLKQASLDSVHEKNVRHGHISTLHIWPARRPLAACRAALIATLLPDPSAEPKPEGMSDEEWQKETVRRRQELCEKIGGKVVKKIERKRMPNGQIVEREKEVTEGGILHWGRETENKEMLDWFREQIRKAYGGRAPKVLDPFAGGGAIPLEAMRLGCEATAIDINPVAWFILKCTLEYPQKLAGKMLPLAEFILRNEAFMREFFQRAKGYTKGETTKALERLGRELKRGEQGALDFGDKLDIQADLAWHVRAWGKWVLDRARRELARYYPVYADFESLDRVNPKAYEEQPMRLVPLREDGTADIDALNKEFSAAYLVDKRNPRWVAKPTVAYLWARTVVCKNCRAEIPLLKTRWLCRKHKKRILLQIAPKGEDSGVWFRIDKDVPVRGGNAAQRREYDRQIAAGTMTRSGAKCPCCNTIVTTEDIRLEGQAGRLGARLTAVMFDGLEGREYRLPTEDESGLAVEAESRLSGVYRKIPFGLPEEPLPSKEALGFRVPLYGFDQWRKLFTSRQLLALGTFLKESRAAQEALRDLGRPDVWTEAISSYLCCGLDRLLDRSSTLCTPDPTPAQSGVLHTFSRFAMPITWDFIEGVTIESASGGYISCLEWVAKYCEQSVTFAELPSPLTMQQSAVQIAEAGVDVICTDPPYYDAIPYSDLMDFFYVWLRRSLRGLSSFDSVFEQPLAPKWDTDRNDGELIDDSSRHGGDRAKSKSAYEQGMSRAFEACSAGLTPQGRLVIVFAHKQPDAWETLVSAIVRAGFVVDSSWPIQTEMGNRMRALTGAALSSSVWLVCRKRSPEVRPGWDTRVLEAMRVKLIGKRRTGSNEWDTPSRLHDFWDAGIRGPDFVWAATGPALEAYSQHPVVKKANDPAETMSVSEFLRHVRRMVVDFVVGRVLSGDGEAAFNENVSDKLDDPTAYYLLHRNDFGLEEAPVGACILYAVSCGLSDRELADTWNLISYAKGKAAEEVDEEENSEVEDDVDADVDEGSGSKVKLKGWTQRKGRSLGYEAPGGKAVPLIDRVHRLMHLWKGGDLHRVDEYLDDNGLRRHELFKRLLQSLIELAAAGSEERSLLESISNHVGAKGAVADEKQVPLALAGQDQ